jgi:hypothetical protein
MKKTLILIVFMLLFSLFSGFASAALVQPSYNVGDHWEYNVKVDSKDFVNPYIVEIKNQTIIEVDNTSYNVWEITQIIPWTGFDTYNITTYYNTTDLAKIKEIFDLEINKNNSNNEEDNSSISENSSYTMSSYISRIVTSYYSEHSEYIFKEKQPDIKYPVKTDDTWTFDNTHILLNKTSNQENMIIPHFFDREYTYKCLGKTIFNTDIGEYECYIIEKKYIQKSFGPSEGDSLFTTETKTLYYSNDLGNYIKSTNNIHTISTREWYGEIQELETDYTTTEILKSCYYNDTAYSFEYISEKNTEIDTEINNMQLFIGLLFAIFIIIVFVMYIRKKRN